MNDDEHDDNDVADDDEDGDADHNDDVGSCADAKSDGSNEECPRRRFWSSAHFHDIIIKYKK